MKTKKILALALAAVLLVAVGVGGTLAWLTDSTGKVTNTFTGSDVDIELGETTGPEYPMVPSVDIEKDPTVTVKADSEACYVYVVIEETGVIENTYTFDDYLEYAYATGWQLIANTQKTDTANDVYVLGQAVADTDDDQTFGILAGDKVTTKDDVTKAMMDKLTKANRPTLSFTAYAIQQANGNDTEDGLFSIEEAWTQLKVTLPIAVNPTTGA